ncbi:MAG: CbrC family protein [Lentisphaeraceae bacterium]|nr:CbrC family protein [Lentisphaeraceae bacterium]
MIIKTKYFEAPLEHCHPYYPGCDDEDDCEICKFCGTKSQYIYEIEESDDEEFGCIDCLINKKFTIPKSTEIGDIDENGNFYKLQEATETKIEGLDLENITESQINDYINSRSFSTKILQTPDGYRKEQIQEIIRTPNVTCFQDLDHPVHCKDFMKYIGRWAQEDFHKNATDGDGEKLWKQMIEEDMNHLWEETEKEIEYYGTEWPQYETSNWAHGSCVYVFECTKCKSKICHWDCD